MSYGLSKISVFDKIYIVYYTLLYRAFVIEGQVLDD